MPLENADVVVLGIERVVPPISVVDMKGREMRYGIRVLLVVLGVVLARSQENAIVLAELANGGQQFVPLLGAVNITHTEIHYLNPLRVFVSIFTFNIK